MTQDFSKLFKINLFSYYPIIGVQTNSLHSDAIQFGVIYNSSFYWQSQVDRNYITVHIFRHKLRLFMNFIIKHEVFWSGCCCMYKAELRKRGLPHAYAEIWLCNKITSNEIDNAICAEKPGADVVDQNKHRFWRKISHMNPMVNWIQIHHAWLAEMF